MNHIYGPTTLRESDQRTFFTSPVIQVHRSAQGGETLLPPYLLAGGAMPDWYRMVPLYNTSDAASPSKPPSNPPNQVRAWPGLRYTFQLPCQLRGTHLRASRAQQTVTLHGPMVSRGPKNPTNPKGSQESEGSQESKGSNESNVLLLAVGWWGALVACEKIPCV